MKSTTTLGFVPRALPITALVPRHMCPRSPFPARLPLHILLGLHSGRVSATARARAARRAAQRPAGIPGAASASFSRPCRVDFGHGPTYIDQRLFTPFSPICISEGWLRAVTWESFRYLLSRSQGQVLGEVRRRGHAVGRRAVRGAPVAGASAFWGRCVGMAAAWPMAIARYALERSSSLWRFECVYSMTSVSLYATKPLHADRRLEN
jgi:hypothetical protein